MADIIYTVNQDNPDFIPGFEQYLQADKDLVSTFEVNNLFDSAKNFIELHILSLTDDILESHYDYSNYKLLGNAQSAGKSGASILSIDAVEDTKAYGYYNGGIKLLYHFLNDLYTQDKTSAEFFIESISDDRTELRLQTFALSTEEVLSYTNKVKDALNNTSYFTEFRLNFKDNNLLIGTNIDTVDYLEGKAVVVKLYEPLPSTFNEKSTLSIVEVIADSVVYEVDSEIVVEPITYPTLRDPNFNLDISEQSIVPTSYYDYNELFSYPISNANSEIYSLVSEKGAEISIDHTDYKNFIHFSSAQERLINFKYKLDLITSYSGSLSSASNATTGLQGISGSTSYYEGLISGVVNNFDHYERFLYYESGSSSWPKSNITRPYINIPSSVTEAQDWYNSQLTEALAYDRVNDNSLIYSIPTYLRDNPDNDRYLTYIYMIGQHFDNLWIYGKAVTDKYDADNRIDFGISKDLVAEALKNFGVKLYTSNNSIEDLFGSFIGQSYQSGSEIINNYITGTLTGSNTPIEPSSYDNYNKEVQKRIYHNLSYLLKTKGTERGVRALINCYGIPSEILQIKLFGGRNVNERPFFGDYQYYTSSLDKIRLDNTGSKIPGETLSLYTSTRKKEYKYTDDLHSIEVGFSPTDNIDAYIISHSAATFNIDNYIGDPRDLTTARYNGLYNEAESILGDLERYNLQDFVRLIKFFDNTIFKSIKDFIPARVVADTGIIIKPNLLNRSKAKSVSLQGTRPERSGSIDTAFIESSDGGIYDSGSVDIVTRYLRPVKTPQGTFWKKDHNHEEARYDGELYNNQITITDGELQKNNPYLNPIYPTTVYTVGVYATPPAGLCLLTPNAATQYTSINSSVNLCNFFYPTNANTEFSIGPDPTNLTQLPTQIFSFGNQAGETYYVQATDPNSTQPTPCIKNTTIITEQCTVLPDTTVQTLVSPGQVITLSDYFTNPNTVQVEYSVNNTPLPGTTYTVPANAITTNILQFTVTAKSYGGTCTTSRVFNISTTTVALRLEDEYVTTLDARITITTLAGNPQITEKGIVWSSTNTNPTVGGAGCTKLTSSLQPSQIIPIYPHPLTPTTQYYLRAYVTTALGTVYSNTISTTTRDLGSITITPEYTANTIRFNASVTNSPFLPIVKVPILVQGSGPFGTVIYQTQLRDGFTLEYTSPDPAFVNTAPTIKYGELITPVAGSHTGTYITLKQYLQSNTNYRFRAKMQYTQGATPHILEVVSNTVSYFSPALNIGDTFQGGVVFDVTQNTNPGFIVNGVPTRKVLVLNPSDYAKANTAGTLVETPVYDGSYSVGLTQLPSREAAGENPPNKGGFSDWRLPTKDEQIILHSVFESIGPTGLSLKASNNSGRAYWNGSSRNTGFTALKFTSQTTPITSDDIFTPAPGATVTAGGGTSYYHGNRYWVRSVRLATQTTL